MRKDGGKKSYVWKAHKVVQVYLFFSYLLLELILNYFALDEMKLALLVSYNALRNFPQL